MPEPVELLRNPRSERVKAVAALHRRAARQRRGRFLVEGPHGVRSLLRYAAPHALDVYLSEHSLAHHQDIVHVATRLGAAVRACTDDVLHAMADTQHPQGVLAVARTVDVSLAQALATVGDGFVAILSNVRDPGNAGTVIRAADAFGASAVLIGEASVDLYNPKVIRSSAGSVFHLPISIGAAIPELLGSCRAAGLRLLAADGQGDTLLPEVDLRTGHAWVLGNEAWGLPEPVPGLCDDIVAVPIHGRAESLNLAMAATVCLHASSTARAPG